MKKTCLFLLLMCSFSLLHAQENTVNVKEENKMVYFQNKKVKLSFSLDRGFYSISNSKGEKIVDWAFFQENGLQSNDDCEKRTWEVADVQNALYGKGKVLTITVAFENYADMLWQVTLFEKTDHLEFNMGIKNKMTTGFRLMNFSPITSNEVYSRRTTSNYKVLDGNGGGIPTFVTDTASLKSFNNAMVTFGKADTTCILVAGGITYNEFEKFVHIKRKDKKGITLKLFAEDPTGRLVDAGQTYWPNEQMYLCFNNENPFEALEKYAAALKQTQNVQLNYYDFVTECLWYGAHYNNDKSREKFNNTPGAVEEMDNAIKSGITKFTKVAIRLVPDAYGADNQQGWWDDKHWGMYIEKMSSIKPHYAPPYLTTESWTKAIIEKGGYPFTYFQSGRRSEDFVKLHPDWMLFNDPHRPMLLPHRLSQECSYKDNAVPGGFHWWADRLQWGYDFTDPGFIKHMQGVYANLRKAGIKGMFFDYPEETAWAYEGGFENKYATTASAYRNMFKLAYDGLGKDALIQERNIIRGSDIALGLVSSHRVWWDTDNIEPEMVSRCGLRWYKNRTVINYDMDSKDPSDVKPLAHKDGNRAMLTMCYVTSGRFLLGRSWTQLSKEELHDLSRIFPYHTMPQSARPLDAFTTTTKFPKIYDYAVNKDWHQLTFYNYNKDASAENNTIRINMEDDLNNGGMQLDKSASYYVYDFWNDAFVGKFSGNSTFSQQLRPGEARMMSVHTATNVPQFISTNRHLMQGMLDVKACNWIAKAKSLQGTSDVVEGDTYKIVIATNGLAPVSCTTPTGKTNFKWIDQAKGVGYIEFVPIKSGEAVWSIRFK